MRPGAGETDLRGWEWHYLARLAGHGRPLLPARDARLNVTDGGLPPAFSADGGRMVLAVVSRRRRRPPSRPSRWASL